MAEIVYVKNGVVTLQFTYTSAKTLEVREPYTFKFNNLSKATVTKITIVLVGELGEVHSLTWPDTIVWTTDIPNQISGGDITTIVFDLTASNTITGNWLEGTSGSGGGGGDLITDHLTDIENLDDYYYGYNRNNNWEILKNKRADIDNETLANAANNTETNLTDAWNNRTSLIYS